MAQTGQVLFGSRNATLPRDRYIASLYRKVARTMATSDFRLINRSYSPTLVRFGAHYVPRDTLVLAVSEALLIAISLLLATTLRFWNRATVYDYLAHQWFRFAVVGIASQLAFYYNNMYDRRTVAKRSLLFTRTLRAIGVAFLALSVLYYVFPPLRLERGIVILAAAIVPCFTIAWRLALCNRKSFSRSVERVLFLGTEAHGIGVTQEIMRAPELQYKIVGFLEEKAERVGQPLVSPGIIGGIAQLEEIVETEQIDRLVISLGERRGVMPIHQLAALKFQGLPIEDAHSMYERITGRIMLQQLQPSWLVLCDGFHKSNLLIALKRVIDIAVSAVLILLTLPVVLLTAIAIRMESRGPVLFKQERIGLGGRPFQILKFRSMRQGSGNGPPSWTSDRDPRITRVGNFIRKFRIDELPQLLNILCGKMSLVGPRPEVPYFCELLEREIPYFNQRHSVRPGLTGWAQVKYQYGASLEEAKIKFEFDLFYIKHLSLLLDLSIIFETAKVVLLGRGAK
jgi:sugar transferase (PEP-CTERM system associated)